MALMYARQTLSHILSSTTLILFWDSADWTIPPPACMFVWGIVLSFEDRGRAIRIDLEGHTQGPASIQVSAFCVFLLPESQPTISCHHMIMPSLPQCTIPSKLWTQEILLLLSCLSHTFGVRLHKNNIERASLELTVLPSRPPKYQITDLCYHTKLQLCFLMK